MDKPTLRTLVAVKNVQGTCNLLAGLPSRHRTSGTFARRSENFAFFPSVATSGKSSITFCNILTLHRKLGITDQQNIIVFVLGTNFLCKDMSRRSHSSVSSSHRVLNFRVVSQNGRKHVFNTHKALRQFGRFKVSSDSRMNGTDAEDVSYDAKEHEVPPNSVEFIHQVSLDVLAPPDLVWKLWTDIKSVPLWMRWIDRVDFLDDDAIVGSCQDLPPGLSRLSRWICSTIGFEVMWVARVENVESNLPMRVLRWATVEGLPSRGQVTFKENDTKGTTVELSISHSLPAALGRVMQSGALRSLVQATLQTDLECFQKYATKVVKQQLECITNGEDCNTERKGSLSITTACSQNLRDSR